MCTEKLADGPLICVRTDEHTTHVYESTSADVRGQEKSDGGGDGE